MMHKAIMGWLACCWVNTGTTRSLHGPEVERTSGYAISLRQQASGITIIGNLFVNYREALKQLAEIRISNIRQTFTAPMFMRITDDPTAETIICQRPALHSGSGSVYSTTRSQAARSMWSFPPSPHAASIHGHSPGQLMQMIAPARSGRDCDAGLADHDVRSAAEGQDPRTDPDGPGQLGMNTEPMTGGGRGTMVVKPAARPDRFSGAAAL